MPVNSKLGFVCLKHWEINQPTTLVMSGDYRRHKLKVSNNNISGLS